MRGGECWVLPDIRIKKLEQLSGQLGLFQLSQMSQECAELGTTSQLPSPPPPLSGPTPCPFSSFSGEPGISLIPSAQPGPSVFCRGLSKARVHLYADPCGLG